MHAKHVLNIIMYSITMHDVTALWLCFAMDPHNATARRLFRRVWLLRRWSGRWSEEEGENCLSDVVSRSIELDVITF